ncbi:MAG: T9SS type A sorting domain-containing protein [Bacteroidota bacterium]
MKTIAEEKSTMIIKKISFNFYRMNYCKILMLILLDSIGISALTQVQFQRYYAPLGFNFYYGHSVIQDVDSGYFSVGTLGHEPDNYDKLLLMKTDKNGDLLWVKTYDSMCAARMQRTSDNAVIICGNSTKYWYPPNACLMKVSLSGDSLWKKRYILNSYTSLNSVTQTFDSGFVSVGYYVTGFIAQASISDALIIKTNSLGDTLWTRRYGWPNSFNDARYVVESANHEIVFCGTSSRYDYSAGIDSLAVMFFRLDSAGNILTKRLYSFYEKIDAFCMTKTPGGGYLISGSNNSQAYFIKTNSYGDTIWTKHVSYEDYELNARSIIQAVDSGYMWCGDGAKPLSWWNSVVILGKLSETGSSEWEKSYNVGDSQRGFNVNLTQDSGFIIVGDSARLAIYLIKTDEGGVITNIVDKQNSDVKAKPYPNPAHNYIEGTSDKAIESLVLYTLTGIPVIRQDRLIKKSKSFRFPILNIAPGMYLFKITFTDGSSKTFPIIHN